MSGSIHQPARKKRTSKRSTSQFSIFDSPWIVQVCGQIGYGVSRDGRVWTRWTKNGKGFKALREIWAEMTPCGGEYKSVHFDGHTNCVHRLVVEAFIGKIPDGMAVDHLDSFPSNNHVENLEIVTYAENSRRASERKRMAYGSRNGNAKATDEIVKIIRNDYSSGNSSRKELAQKFNLGESTINQIINRKTWKHLEDMEAA